MVKRTYDVINIHEYLKNDLINELQETIDSFACEKNSEVEYFLKHNAINFAKKGQAITYFIFDETQLLGYFTLALKPIMVDKEAISRNMAKRLERVSDINNNEYHLAAYLIAQLGKNYNVPRDERITGAKIMELAMEKVYNAKLLVGGVVVFLECEDNSMLTSFYEQLGYIHFDERISQNDIEFLQYMKSI